MIEEFLSTLGFLSLSILYLKPIRKLPVLSFKVSCPLLLAEFLLFQLCKLRCGPPPLRPNFKHVHALPIGS